MSWQKLQPSYPSRPKRLQRRSQPRPRTGQPFEVLRNQVDRLFHDFQTGFLQGPFFRPLPDIESFWRRDLGFKEKTIPVSVK